MKNFAVAISAKCHYMPVSIATMHNILILEPLLNSYKTTLFFKSKEPDISTLRGINLLKKKYNVTFIDFKVDNPSKTDIITKIISHDSVFINVKTYNYRLSCEIIRLAYAVHSGIEIHVFGQLPEARPSLFKHQFKKIHVVEGEFYEFALHCGTELEKKKSKIRNLTYKSMDEIPEVDIEELKKRDYYTIYPQKKIRHSSFGFMSLSEGCSYKCIFCSQTLRISHGTEYRHFSVKDAIKRIRLTLDSGFNAIRFLDDDFIGDADFTRNLCKKIINEKMHFSWMAQVRVSKVHEPLLKLMKKAGCECISFGIETGSERLLQVLKKDISLDQITKAVALCKKHGIKIVTYFMVGLPSETTSDIKESISLSFRLKPDLLQICYFVPYEGSSFCKSEKSAINSPLQESFHYNRPQKNYSNIAEKKLSKIFLSWYLKYYLCHPIKTIKILGNLFLFHPKRIFKVGLELLRMLASSCKTQ
jgi:radical SAM superfamily enzyme YgiQ (UPF0313 family)